MKKLFLLTLALVLLCTWTVMAAQTPTTSSPNVKKAVKEKAQTPESAVTAQQVERPLDQQTPASFSYRSFGKPTQPVPFTEQFCDANTLYGQHPFTPNESWAFNTSDLQLGPYLVADDFPSISDILDLHWWGLSLFYSAGWTACNDPGEQFTICFYNTFADVPGNPIYTFTPVVPSQINTGENFAGIANEIRYDYYFPAPVVMPAGGVLSIQAIGLGGDIGNCSFLWATSPDGDNDAIQIQSGVPVQLYQNQAFCLTGEYIPAYGACCDDVTGICTENVERLDCPAPLRWAINTLCADLVPLCGETGCPDATITVEILTDNYGSETTWDVRDPANNVIGSGGPYGNNTLYLTDVCATSGVCYLFTIYDAYGDGICCNYGYGYVRVYWNGVLQAENLNFNSSSWSAQVGDGCQIPTGACCVGLECVATNTQVECNALGGTWYEGQTCPEFVCPEDPLACPSGTVYAHPWGNPGSANTSDASFGYRVYDTVDGFSGDVLDLHWWGLKAYINGGWVPCAPDEEPMTFNIAFYPDAGGQPDRANPTCTYSLPVPSFFTGELLWDYYAIYSWNVNIPTCTIANGWFSVQDAGGDANCNFAWINTGNAGNAYQEYPDGSMVALGMQFVYCLTGEYVPQFGACCDPISAVCVDNVESINCLPPLQFTANTLCADLVPPCGECPDAKVTVEILTDTYGGETTWILQDVDGNVVGSGGPYAGNTLYVTPICVPAGCYTFTIYDSFGDGICCDYGYGYYRIYYNGVMECENLNFTGSEASCQVGNCTGACCVGEDCVGDMSPAECAALGGTIHVGESCAGGYTCPPPPMDCSTALYQNGPGDGGNTAATQCDLAFGFTAEIAADFVLSADATLGAISFTTNGWNGFTSPYNYGGVTFSIYPDAGGVPGGNHSSADCSVSGAIWTNFYPAGDYGIFDDGLGNWQIDAVIPNPGLDLTAGTYWLGVLVTNDFNTNGQSGWQFTANITGSPALLYSDYFGYYWADVWSMDVAFCLHEAQGGSVCGPYVVGDYNGNGAFNLADVIWGYGKLKGQNNPPGLLCECPAGSGNTWAVAGDVNASCAFNLADIIWGYGKLKGQPNTLAPCGDCPPGAPAPRDGNKPLVVPNLKSKVKIDTSHGAE